MIPRIALATAILAAAAANLPMRPAEARGCPAQDRDCVAAGCLGIAGITATAGADPAWAYEVQVQNRSPTARRDFRVVLNAPGATSTASPQGHTLPGGESRAFPMGHSAQRIPDDVLRAHTQIRCLA